MFSQKSAGESCRTGSVAAGSSHRVHPLNSPETKKKKREDVHIREVTHHHESFTCIKK